MTAQTCAKTLSSPAETARAAVALAGILKPGDCVLLEGGLGAGKTHLARSLIQSVLHSPEDVPSPTFTLVQEYDTRIGEIWHADLYRIGSTQEIEELGLSDAFHFAICLIEWPDRLGDLRPKNALTLTLSLDEASETRNLTVTWDDPAWTTRLREICT